jgi:hypothetical protein
MISELNHISSIIHKLVLMFIIYYRLLTIQSVLFLRITEFSDFVLRLVFEKLEKTASQKLDLFPSSGGRGGGDTTLSEPLERANLSHFPVD